MNYFKRVYIVLFFILINEFSFSQAKLNKISKEQKLYELSTVWKELSYNFANMDNCPGLNIDSLYRAYIPIVQKTKNDFEYWRSLQHFLAHFCNGHTNSSMPGYIIDQLSYPKLVTSYNKGKLLIENIGSHYSKKVHIGDEIVEINRQPAMKYLITNNAGYESVSVRDTATMDFAMFDPHLSYMCYAPKTYKRKLLMKIRTEKGSVTIKIPYDVDLKPLPCDTARQNKIHYIKERIITDVENLFFTKPDSHFAYLRLNSCDKESDTFFQNHQSEIKKYDNLILDLTGNHGGDGNATNNAIYFLVDKDSLQWNIYKSRINISDYRAAASSRIYYYKPSAVTQEDKDFYYPYFYDRAFEEIPYEKFKNPISSTERYKGNIYVLTSSATASAAEFFTVVLSLNPKTKIVGKKTAGANGKPLVIQLPSGIEVFINTSKAYDYKGIDISNGIRPDYEYDLSSFYKTNNLYDSLLKFEDFVKGNIKK